MAGNECRTFRPVRSVIDGSAAFLFYVNKEDNRGVAGDLHANTYNKTRFRGKVLLGENSRWQQVKKPKSKRTGRLQKNPAVGGTWGRKEKGLNKDKMP